MNGGCCFSGVLGQTKPIANIIISKVNFVDKLVLPIQVIVKGCISPQLMLIIQKYIERFINENINLSQIENDIQICVTDDYQNGMTANHLQPKQESFATAGFHVYAPSKHYLFFSYNYFHPITFNQNRLNSIDKNTIDESRQLLKHMIYHEFQHLINSETIMKQIEASPSDLMCLSNTLCDEYIAVYNSYSSFPISISDSLEKLEHLLKNRFENEYLFIRDLYYFVLHIIAYNQINIDSGVYTYMQQMADNKFRDELTSLKFNLDGLGGVASKNNVVYLRNSIESSVKNSILQLKSL